MIFLFDLLILTSNHLHCRANEEQISMWCVLDADLWHGMRVYPLANLTNQMASSLETRKIKALSDKLFLSGGKKTL